MTTMRAALRGVKRVRWWRRNGTSVAIATMGVLIVFIICNIVKLATDLGANKTSVVPPVATTKVTLQKTTTLTLKPIVELPEESNSNEQDNIQQYMEETFEISSMNYYSARNVSTGYSAEVVNPVPTSKQQVYTYLGRTYDEEDVQNIARIAWFEQGICGKEMTQLAAAVLINRSHWTEFGSTYLECFYQDGQYAIQTIQKYESSEEIPEEAYEWIRELLRGESEYGEVPATVVFQAQFPQGIDTYATAANTYICYADESLLGEYIP